MFETQRSVSHKQHCRLGACSQNPKREVDHQCACNCQGCRRLYARKPMTIISTATFWFSNVNLCILKLCLAEFRVRFRGLSKFFRLLS